VKPTSQTVAVKPAAKRTGARPGISAPGKGAKVTVMAKTPTPKAGSGKATQAKTAKPAPAPVAKPTPAPAPVAKAPEGNKTVPNGKSASASSLKPANGKPARPPLVPGGTLVPPPSARPKPGKNLAGLSPKELEQFREALLAKRRELVGDMYSMEREALQRSGENLSNLPLHMADMGTDNYEQEFTLGLMEKDRQLLREINSALQKINDGTYGICEGTGKPIAKVRLEVQPWAKYSIEHARKLENRGVR
jgi:RNA polymerase-binding protein DksA